MNINEGKTYKEYYEAEYGKKKKVITWSAVSKNILLKDKDIMPKKKWSKNL